MIFSFAYPATTKIYTLSLHDALPIFYGDATNTDVHSKYTDLFEFSKDGKVEIEVVAAVNYEVLMMTMSNNEEQDRKSTRLNSSHVKISYAVFCLKKKKIQC